jgi:hypothetical protein
VIASAAWAIAGPTLTRATPSCPLVFDYSVLEVLDERMSSLRLVAYVPAPGTGRREKMEKLLAVLEPVLPASLELEPH